MPHVILTSDVDWDPSVLDHTLDGDEEWFDAISDLQEDPATNLFDEFGNYRKCIIVQEAAGNYHKHLIVQEAAFLDAFEELPPSVDDAIDECVLHHSIGLYEAHAHEVMPKEPDYEALRLHFGWLPTDIIK